LQGMTQYTLVQKEQENGGLLRESDFEEVKANIGNLVNELSSEAEKEVKQKASNMGIETQVTLTGEDVKKIKQQLVDSIEQNKKIWVARKKEIVNDTTVKAMMDITTGKLNSFDQLAQGVMRSGEYVGLKLDDTAYRTIYNMLKAKIDGEEDKGTFDNTAWQMLWDMFYQRDGRKYSREELRSWILNSTEKSPYHGKVVNGIAYGTISAKTAKEMLNWIEKPHILSPVVIEANKYIESSDLLPEDKARAKKSIDEKIARNPDMTTEEAIDYIQKIATKSPDISTEGKKWWWPFGTTLRKKEEHFIEHLNSEGNKAAGYIIEEVPVKYKDPKTGKIKIIKEIQVDDEDYYRNENVLGYYKIEKLAKKMRANINLQPVKDQFGRKYYLLTTKDGKHFWITYHFNFTKNPTTNRYEKKSDRFYIYSYDAIGLNPTNSIIIERKKAPIYADMETDSNKEYRKLAEKILTLFEPKRKIIPVIKKRGR